MEDHLAAGRAFPPKIFRRLAAAFADQFLDAGTDEIGDPVHARTLASEPAWMESARARQSSATAATIRSRPASWFSAMTVTMAEPTTAAAAMLAIWAACAGVRMPNPTATGRLLAFLIRANAAFT